MFSAFRTVAIVAAVAIGSVIYVGGSPSHVVQVGASASPSAAQASAVAQSPSVSPAAEAGYAAVTATSDCGETIEDGISQMGSPPYGVTGLVLGCDNTASDPRVSGQGTVTLNIETWDPTVRFYPGTNMVFWGDVLINGPEGSWSGRQYGIYDSEGTVHVFGVLAGSGTYEGWSYATSGTIPGPTGNTLSESVGVIYHGSPPPGFPVEPFPSPASK